MKTVRSFVVVFAFAAAFDLPLAIAAQEPDRGNSPEVLALLKERRDTLQALVVDLDAQFHDGSLGFDVVLRGRSQLLDAELQLASMSAQRISILERRVENFKELEKLTTMRWNNAGVTRDKVLEAKAARLAAQIELQREREKNT